MHALLKTLQRCLRRPQSRVQLLSDLHLEVGQQYSSFTFPVTAPFLLLAGDIGRLIDYDNYLVFLETQASRYKKVFLVLGNHEFYGLDYDSGLDMARRLSEEPSLINSIVLLHRARWDDPDSDLTMLGCTLWSAIPEEASGIIESRINDFKKITGWTVQEHNKVHVEEVAWLREQVARVAAQEHNTKRQLLIATHHAPCLEGTSQPKDSNNPWTPAFATNLVTQGGWDGVKTWIFGHTHYSTDLQRNGIRLVANQRGYVIPGSATQKGEESKTKKNAHDFDPTMVIRL